MEIEIMPLGHIGANCYILYEPGEEACIVIDPGDEPETAVRKLDSLSLVPAYILLTHGHPDHVGGVGGVKKAFPGAVVMIHEADSQDMRRRQHILRQSAGDDIDAADRYYAEGDEVTCGGMRLQVIHTPGHSPGGVCLYAQEEACLFSGDTLFRATVGRTDFPGGNYSELENSIRNKLYLLPPDTLVFPGHSSSTVLLDEMKYNPVISADPGRGR